MIVQLLLPARIWALLVSDSSPILYFHIRHIHRTGFVTRIGKIYFVISFSHDIVPHVKLFLEPKFLTKDSVVEQSIRLFHH